jgi:hypothetical protein
VGCDEAETYQVYDAENDLYSGGSEADVNLQCLDIARLLKRAKETKSKKSSKSSKSKSPKSGKASRNLRSSRELSKADDKCEAKGGQCVVYCDITSLDYDCKMGLCDVDIEYDTPVDVLNSGKYYTACSCKVPKY